MTKKYPCSLFIFRRDLRVTDNTALIKALELSEKVIACFICDPQQITEKNSYKSNNALQFMRESLEDLRDQLKHNQGHLYIFNGKPLDIIEDIYRSHHFDALFLNHDYTPYSKKRDTAIKDFCSTKKITYNAYHDTLLHNPYDIMTHKGTPYTVFTPFFKRASQEKVVIPHDNNAHNYYTGHIINEYNPQEIIREKNADILVHGGRTKAIEILATLKNYKNYEESRDFPTEQTTRLSAHNKFGTVSIREVYYAIKNALGVNHALIRQLYWRDFYTSIAAHFPQVFGHAFIQKYDSIPWKNDKEFFKKWCQGTTGFPIVDAGMRQLNTTGWMHNRVRMIVASFLTKDLHINWQWGEKYFAQKLVDYDPAVNNGSWQWAASTGCDAQPYFRIFNPWLQQKKFDPECTYIKQWVPELKHLDPEVIHTLYSKKILIKNYNHPIIDHTEQARYAQTMFSQK